jgi:hypothetical protein
MFSYAYDFTPTVEVASIDEGYFDLRGNRKRSAREIAEVIRKGHWPKPENLGFRGYRQQQAGQRSGLKIEKAVLPSGGGFGR